MLETATSTYGRLDILCNNAGIMDLMTPAADVPLALWDRVLAVNLTGPFLACRRAIPLMLQQGGGSIVNTASEAGLRGGAAGTPYTVSKHGVVGLTKSIASVIAFLASNQASNVNGAILPADYGWSAV